MWLKKKKLIQILCLSLFYISNSFFFVYGREPFRPLVDTQGRVLIPRQVDIQGMSLEGILYSEGRPVAIINGEVLRENEAIGQYTVVKIERDVVVLVKDGKEYNLELEVD